MSEWTKYWGTFMVIFFGVFLFHTGLAEEKAEAKVCPPGEFPFNETFMSAGNDDPADDTIIMKCKNPTVETGDNTQRQINVYGEYLYKFLKVLQVMSSSIAIFLIVLAGHAYIMSQGQQQGIERAKNMMILAVVGFFMTSTSFVIMRIVTEVVGVTSIGPINF